MEVKDCQLTGTGEKCLICHSNHLGLSLPTNFSDKGKQLSSSALSTHLSAYFLLRHVLELSSEQLETYLRISPNPEDWVKICAECSANYVEECESTFMEMVEAKRRFARAKSELIEAIKRSVSSEAALEHGKRGRVREIPSGFILDVDLETRRFVGKNEYPEQQSLLVNPFIAGDRMANRASEGIHSSILKEEPPSPEVDSNCTSTTQELLDDSGDSMMGDISSKDDWYPDDKDVSNEEECEESETEEPSSAVASNKMMTVRKRGSLSIQKEHKQRGERKSRHKCDICSEMFKTPVALRKHQILIHKTNLYKCSQCEWKSFGRHKASLLNHMKRCHGPEKDAKEEIMCPKCQKILYSKSGYRQHRAICQNTERPIMKCDLCGKEFLTKYSLLTHKGAVHGITDHLIFKCSFENCTRSYAKKSSLVDHEITHKPPEHQCQICGERFRKIRDLKRHMLLHESEKAFQCEHCASRFARNDNLLKHMRATHGQVGERRQRKYLKCSECEWKTQVKIGMKGHLAKLHGGVGQFTEVYIWD